MKYDVIVVGAGSAGTVVAARVSEDPNRSVLLLEAGPDYPDFQQLPDDLKLGNYVWMSAWGPHNWGYVAQFTPQQRDISIPRGKVTGGTSAINGQVLYRGTPEDYDRWAELGNYEWAFTKLLPYFRKMENDHDFPGGDFHGNDGPMPVRRYPREEWLPLATAFHQACLEEGFRDDPDQNHPDSTGVSPRARNTIDGIRISTSLAYLDASRHRLNLTVRANVTAQRIIFEGKRAIGLEVESAGERFTIEGDQIVLSSGAIGSPHLLLLSGIGPADQLKRVGLDVIRDLPGVGKNLRDHPKAAVVFRAKSERPDVQAPAIQVGLRYTAEGSYLHDDMQISPNPLTSEPLPDLIETDDDGNYIGMSVGLQLAVGSGELKLTSPDPNVQPLLDYRYLTDPFDRERMRKAIRFAVQLSEHPAFKELVIERVTPTDVELASDDALDDWLMRYITTSHHLSGTCKMGEASDPMAVLDQYGWVHGVEGLRVADASIMPDCVRAPTNATVIMIGERIADWIKRGT